MKPMPARYLLIAVCAGLSSWAAFRAGKGHGAVSAMFAAKPSAGTKASQREARERSTVRKVEVSEIRRFMGRNLEDATTEELLEAWELIRSFSKSQVKEGLEITGRAWDGANPNLLALMLYTRWSELDPEAAVKSAQGLPEEGAARTFGGVALWNWVKSDPEAAYLWSKKNEEFAKNCNHDTMISAMLVTEPVGSALEKAKLLGDEVLRMTMSHFAGAAAGDEEKRAIFIAEAAKLPGEYKDMAVFQMHSDWALDDPEKALSSVEGAFDNEDLKKRAAETIVSTWAKRDPQQALAWLGANPPPNLIEQQASIWKRWVTEIPDSAQLWLSQQGDSPALAETIVRQIQSRQLNQTLGIGGKAARREKEALRQTYRLWAMAKPEQAKEWLKNADPQVVLTLTSSEP